MSEQPPQSAGAADSSESTPAAPSDASTSYGRAPPPSSAYPAPIDGGFGPPVLPGPDASGRYGPPGPGYGASGSDYGVPTPQAPDSLANAWRAFKDNPWPFVVSQVIWFVVMLVPMLVLLAAFGVFAAPRVGVDGSVASVGLGALIGVGGMVVVLAFVLLTVVQYGAFATATLRAVSGERVTLGDFFRPGNVLHLMLLAVLLGIASGVLAITGIGPLIVLFFGIWSVFFVVDRGQSAFDAIGSSITFSARNPLQTILLVLLGFVLNALGVLACGIGTLVTNPVTLLAFADFYRRTTGMPVR